MKHTTDTLDGYQIVIPKNLPIYEVPSSLTKEQFQTMLKCIKDVTVLKDKCTQDDEVYTRVYGSPTEVSDYVIAMYWYDNKYWEFLCPHSLKKRFFPDDK